VILRTKYDKERLDDSTVHGYLGARRPLGAVDGVEGLGEPRPGERVAAAQQAVDELRAALDLGSAIGRALETLPRNHAP
jgi:hypothetical protein